jgi:NAD(P)-dependent dehydrogenase (short-subunit alcohol dehydrogenase family)
VVVVTGGAGGIGRAMVEAFARQRSRVFFCDVDEAAGRELAAESDGVDFQKVDLADPVQPVDWVAKIANKTQRIDVLVNNAARDPRIPLAEMTVAAWDDLFALNLRAYFLMAQSVAPWMDKHGGAMVNFSSLVHHLPSALMPAYVATTSGIIGLTRALARDLGHRRIRVNTLAPGWVMTERQMAEYVTPEAQKRLLHEQQSIPELISPAEVADVALFLASDASRAMTGQELLVDRGWVHH